MPANTSPIYSLTPNVGMKAITTAAVEVGSDGAGTLDTSHFLAFSAGANGSFVQKIRFNCIATAAAVTSVATTLRIYLSTVNTGAITAANTFLLGEVSVPAVVASHSTNGTPYYDFPLNFAIPTGRYIHVSQHVAQTASQNWNAVVFGGDY